MQIQDNIESPTAPWVEPVPLRMLPRLLTRLLPLPVRRRGAWAPTTLLRWNGQHDQHGCAHGGRSLQASA